jgi:nicotinate-nucleotide adenylyltransferase
VPTVGVFGGSFNPIHFGHLLLADEICEALRLDRVLFVPAAVPPHKPAAELASADHRYHMTALAVREHPRFAVSDIELRREGPSYTVDTLAALQGEGTLRLLIGSDTFLDLLSWRDPREVARLAQLIVVPRTGGDFDPDGPAAQKVLHELGLSAFGAADGPVLYRAASLPISGSDLRRRAREGRSLAYRMPEAVAAYIREQGLYRADS